MTRRNYRSSLGFFEDAFKACWVNAQDLIGASKLLFDAGHHAQSLSLSVLAIEELGKLYCVDGLLFARADDEKAQRFAKSLRSHATKLLAFELFPMLLLSIARADPRFAREERFNQAIAISVSDLKERGNEIFTLMSDGSFLNLDDWKQAGFYAQLSGGTFRTPRDSVSNTLSEAVYMLAWRASTTLEFLLKSGNLERYIETARTIRSHLSEADHQQLSEAAEMFAKDIFPTAESSSESDRSVH